MLIQIVLVIFSLLAISKVFGRFRKRELSVKALILWSLLWLAVLAAVLSPKTTDLVAKYVGVGRGADLLVYLAVVVILYIQFRLSVRQDELDHSITKLVRQLALDGKKPKDDA